MNQAHSLCSAQERGELVFEPRRFVELRKKPFWQQFLSPESTGMGVFYTLNVFCIQACPSPACACVDAESPKHSLLCHHVHSVLCRQRRLVAHLLSPSAMRHALHACYGSRADLLEHFNTAHCYQCTKPLCPLLCTSSASPAHLGLEELRLLCTASTNIGCSLQFYLGTTRLQLEHKGGQDHVVTGIANVVPAFGVIGIPVIAWLLDKMGYGITLATINFLGVLASFFQAMPSVWFQVCCRSHDHACMHAC